MKQKKPVQKSANPLFLIFFLLLILGLAALYPKIAPNKDQAQLILQKWGVNLAAADFTFKNHAQDKEGRQKEELELTQDKDTVKLTRIKAESSQKYVEDKKFLFQSLFLPTTSPYPEVITNIIECPEEFKPREREVENGIIYTVFAGERLNYGVCSRDLVEYYAAYGIFDCKQKGVFELQVFSKEKGMPEEIAKTFRCK